MGATLYFLLGAAGEAAGAVAAAISAEAGHLALLVYLREPRRKLPDKINALELLEVRAPEDLSEMRRGGAEGRIRRAQIIAVAFGALEAVLVVMPLAFLGLGIGREELPLLEPMADVLGTMGGAAFAAVFGFAGGFWPNREKERVKELLAEAGDAREFEEAGEGGLVGESTTKPE